jgi:hypothetical protein
VAEDPNPTRNSRKRMRHLALMTTLLPFPRMRQRCRKTARPHLTGCEKRLGSDAAADDHRGSVHITRWYGYYEESRGDYRVRTVFPFGSSESNSGRSTTNAGQDHDADVLFRSFGICGNDRQRPLQDLRCGGGPNAVGFLVGAALFRRVRQQYLHPAVGVYAPIADGWVCNKMGPMFCSWKGGSTCSTHRNEYRVGLAPFFMTSGIG